jgi:membrane protein required for colicin V production
VAFIIILLVVVLVVALLAALLTKLISAVKLGWINRLGGAVLGVFLGAIFVAALLAVWVKVASPDVVANSRIALVLLDKLPFILGLLPSDFDSIRNLFF